jgi:hypothetical protein
MSRPLKTNSLVVSTDPTRVRVLTLRRPKPDFLTNGRMINTTSGSAEVWARGLSPFNVGTCPLYGAHRAQNVENAWQFCKVYPEHVDETGDIKPAYWEWAKAGWADPIAHRFPMGRGRVPLFSLWKDGERLGYIEARKKIYCPVYAEAVTRTAAWDRLKQEWASARQQGQFSRWSIMTDGIMWGKGLR